MIDPITAFGAIKGGIEAGKQLHKMSKEIADFFDSVDNAKKAHAKKRSSAFASANQEAMSTWQAKQDAEDAENDLRELICRTRGYSAYQDLLKIRREINIERKEAKRQAELHKEEMKELALIIFLCLLFAGMSVSALLVYLEILDLKGMF